MEKEGIKRIIISLFFALAALNMISSYNSLNDYIYKVDGKENVLNPQTMKVEYRDSIMDKEFNIVTYNSLLIHVIESVAIFIALFVMMMVKLEEFSILEEIKKWNNK